MSKKQSNMLKEDILKILSKSVSGGSDLAPMYPNSKEPKTFFGGEKPSRAGDADQMKPYYPMAQEPNPAANPNAPLPTRKLEPGQVASKRPTYKSAKEPLTFFGGKEKKPKKKRAPSKYNLFMKDFAKKNPGLGKGLMKAAAAAYRKEHPKAGKAPAKKPMETHVMPDGAVHSGKTHTKDSVVVKPAPKAGKAPAEKKSNIRKIPAPKQTRKPAGAWMQHLKQFRAANPHVKAKNVMKEAKKTYKKSGGAEPTVNPVTKAPARTEPKKPDVSETKVPERIQPDRPAQPVAPKIQRVPEEKSEKDQDQILVDIMESYNDFNKRFEEISNSDRSFSEKRDDYDRERDKMDNYHHEIHQNYSDILSKDKLDKNDAAYKYGLETYKIGVASLKSGVPQIRVDFENFGEDATITEIINSRLQVPRGPMDRARSFHNKEIVRPEQEGFGPGRNVIIPRYGKMASPYPYKYQLKEMDAMGGAHRDSPKKMLSKKVRDLFIRDMKKLKPNATEKKIIKIFNEHKKEILGRAGDAIIDMLFMRGGAHYGGQVCDEDEFRSGDKCYKKQERMVKFDRDAFLAAQKKEADENVRKPDAGPVPSMSTETKPTADAANPLPAPKPQDKDEREFVDKFSAAITPGDRGSVFGTDKSDLSDPRAWVDTIVDIAKGTVDGVATIFEALDPMSWF